MGVLDEAIREHLELKRRHGANPEDVARAEREALGPAVRDRAAAVPAAELARDDSDASVADATAGPAAPTTEPEATLGEASIVEPEPVPLPEPSEPVASELLPPVPPAEPAAPAAETGPIAPPAEAAVPAPPPEPMAVPPPAEEPHRDQPTEVFDAEEIFAEDEDEPFAERPAIAPEEDTPEGAERGGRDPSTPPAAPKEGESEDVLEETPEFLQETPEHDRLWFEQKPPRDFDFDG